jgi:hypothetical protein
MDTRKTLTINKSRMWQPGPSEKEEWIEELQNKLQASIQALLVDYRKESPATDYNTKYAAMRTLTAGVEACIDGTFKDVQNNRTLFPARKNQIFEKIAEDVYNYFLSQKGTNGSMEIENFIAKMLKEQFDRILRPQVLPKISMFGTCTK